MIVHPTWVAGLVLGVKTLVSAIKIKLVVLCDWQEIYKKQKLLTCLTSSFIVARFWITLMSWERDNPLRTRSNGTGSSSNFIGFLFDDDES
jgi:hypothetical protein